MATNWSTRYPVYQIDFQAVASGKMIASSKRKVRWRFGFPNQQALSAGRTGVDCRGEEHDIVIIWSVTSGKRQVYFDGTEIHFSSSRAGIFQYSWSAKGNHVMKVVAHAAPPMTPTPGFRQYDLYIDGQSFFTMPKAYELGIRGPISSQARVPGAYVGGGGYGGASPSGVRAPSSRAQEDADLQRAISASLQESRQFLASKDQSDDRSALTAPPAAAAASGGGDLMDFAGQQGGQPAIPDSQTVMSYNSMPPTYGAAPTTPQYAAHPPPNPYQPAPAYGAQPQPPAPYQNPPPPAAAASNALVLSGAPTNQYGQPPPAAYGAPPQALAAAPAYAAAPVPPQPAAPPAFGAPPPAAYGGAAPPPPQQGAVPTGDLFAPPQADPFAPAAVAPPAAAADPFGFSQPMPHVDDPFAPKAPPPPSRDDINNTILSAYQPHPGQPPVPGQMGVPPGPGQPGQQMPMANGHGQAPQPGMPGMPQAAAGHGLSMNGGYQSIPVAPQQPQRELSEMEKAMKKLVNIDRIDEPAEQEYELTMKKKEEAKKAKDGRSRGLPPVANQVLGSGATLSDIQVKKSTTPKTGEGIMNAPPQLFHPDAVHAGALVVHGQGPPPIQRGFGLGYGAPPPNFQQQRW